MDTRKITTRSFAMTLLAMWLAHFCVDFMIGIWAIFKSIAHIDLAVAGLITAGCVAIGEGCQALFGNLADRGYQKYLMVVGLVACSAALFFPFAPTLLMCTLLCLSVSLGSGAFHPPAAGLMGSLSKARKGMLLTFFWSGGSLGLAMSQLSFAKSLEIFGGHALPLLILPLLVISCLIPLSLPLYSAAAPMGGEARFAKLFQFFKRRDLSLLYATQVGTQIVFWSTIFILPDVLIGKGVSPWVAFGGGHLSFMLGGVIMMVPIGYLADRFTARRVTLVAIGVSILLFYAFLLSPALPASSTLLFLFLLGAGMGVLNPLGVTIGNHLVPEKPALISAFLMGMVWCVTESFGPGGIGLLSKLFEEEAAGKSLMLMGLFMIASFGTAWLLPQEERSSEEETIPGKPVYLAGEQPGV